MFMLRPFILLLLFFLNIKKTDEQIDEWNEQSQFHTSFLLMWHMHLSESGEKSL
jgi:hypothetical protein